MPIILQPVTSPSVDQSLDPSLLKPQPSVTADGDEVAARLMAITASQGQVSTVEWTALTPASGLAVDLTQYQQLASSSSSSSFSSSSATIEDGAPVAIKVRYREALQAVNNYAEVTAAIVDATSGLIRFVLPKAITEQPGVYIAEIGFFYPTDHPTFPNEIIFTNRLYVAVDRGSFGAAGCGGPYTMQEMRLALRDSSPEDSYLNDSIEWDAAEYCMALLRPIEWYNNANPPVKKYNTRNFPHREAWLQGAMAVLYSIAAAYYRREAISYSAAGVSLNDRAKAPEYEQMAQMYEQKFRVWARHNKHSINLRNGYGSTSW